MIPLVVIRPQPGADRTQAAAREQGLDARAYPLFEVAPRAWEPPDPATVDALLIGSANALRHAGPALQGYRDKPVHAVGEATAATAREAGLEVAVVGRGGLQAVLDGVPPATRLLRLAGEERVELVPPPDVTLTERIVYASEPVSMPPELAQLLRSSCVVALHSAAAARHFADQCARLCLARDKLSLVTLGARVSDAAGTGWAGIVTAPTPDDDALLACAAQLCQNAPGA